jgi:Protein of unknown function (DUF2911)
MRINKLSIALSAVIACGLFFQPAAHADEEDEATTITFSTPIQIPGAVLPAGTYLFKLADTESDLNLVQIFNAEGTKLYATLQTVPTQRQEPANNTAVTLAEQGAGNPDALVKWFYPGRLTGNEFLYPDHREQQLAPDTRHTIVASPEPTNSEAQAGD